jgi:hypothetical protein
MKKVAYSAAMILLLAASTHAGVIAAYDYTSTNGAIRQARVGLLL